ncbi:MAG: fibrobacter succinogenes major paralogous domain-containing protein, partial [Dysgonamonadaceae bacterium]|nr:fibrobacter succinogenes major paralogous domain-containing protein [Dysgonamonadaceae bacterium]
SKTYQNDSQGWLPANNPCPSGWRLQTKDEWDAVINTSNNAIKKYVGTSGGNTQSWNTNHDPIPNDNYNNVMKVGDYLYLPAAGARNYSNGVLAYRGEAGYYLSSSPSGSNAYILYLRGYDQGMDDPYRSYGYSVRCVAAD